MYPASPTCSILSSVLQVISADEWSTDGSFDDLGTSTLQVDLSDSSAESSQDAFSQEEGGSDLDGFLFVSSCTACLMM